MSHDEERRAVRPAWRRGRGGKSYVYVGNVRGRRRRDDEKEAL